MDLNNMMTVSDGRRTPPDARLRLSDPKMDAVLRETLNKLRKSGEDRTAPEYMLCHIISETLDTIDGTPPPQSRLFALEKHTLLRASLNILRDRTTPEYMRLCQTISETLDSVDHAHPAQEAIPSPPAPMAS